MTSSLVKCSARALSGVVAVDTMLANRVANLRLGERSVEVTVVPMLKSLGANVIKTSYQLTPAVVQQVFDEFRDQVTDLNLSSCTNFTNVTFGNQPFTKLERFTISAPKAMQDEQFVALCKVLPQTLEHVEVEEYKLAGKAGSLPKTKRLVINGSDITDNDLQEISKNIGDELVELEIINAEGITTFADCNFPNLRSFKAKNIRLTQEGLQILSTISPQLQVLDLDVPRGFSRLIGCSFPSLIKLHITNINFQNEDILFISNSCGESLQELDISACCPVSYFKECNFPQLRVLNAANTRLDNEGLQSVSRAAPNLEVLSLYGCRFMTSYVGCSLPKLLELNCCCSSALSNAELEAIGRMSPELQVLDLSHCQGIIKFAGSFGSLRKLVVQYNPNFTEESLISLSRVASNSLQELFLVQTGLTSIPEQALFHDLRKLDISALPLQNSDLQIVSKLYGPTLVALAISDCNAITSFQDCTFPQLIKLVAMRKTAITEEWLQTLAEALSKRQLDILDLSGAGIVALENKQYGFAKETVWSTISKI